MKKILLNGCSFTAGDAITWDMHHPDIDWRRYIVQRKLHPVYTTKQINDFMLDYKINLRAKDNIAGQLTTLLNTTTVDISIDGNSNDNISLSTIGFLSQLTPEARKEYHVCIGWTEFTRRVRWLYDKMEFFNLHIHHIDVDDKINERGFIKEVIVNSHDLDHLINFLTNVIMLESYLKSNGITYTFWKSLGIQYNKSSIAKPRSVDPQVCSHDFFSFNNTIDSSMWVPIDANPMPWLGESWGDTIDKSRSYVNSYNHHPNLESVKQFSIQVANHIAR